MEWNGGMEYWNGILEWNSGTVKPPHASLAVSSAALALFRMKKDEVRGSADSPIVIDSDECSSQSSPVPGS